MNHADLFFEHFDVLAEAPNGVAKLRELVLQMAVRGKIVEQDENDEPASQLIDKAIGKRNKRKPFLVLNSNDSPTGDEALPAIPRSWTYTTLETLGEISPRNKLDDDLEVSFLPMASIPAKFKGRLDPEVRTWGEIKKGFTTLAEGDVALAKITPCFQNGKVAVMRGLLNGYGAGTTELHVVRPDQECLFSDYVEVFLRSPDFVREGVARMSGSAGQQRVPKDHFAKSPFPLPPLAEQHRIVAKVDQLMALCDELEARGQAKRETRERLVASALDTLTSARDASEFDAHWPRLRDHFDLLFDHPSTIPPLRQAILQLAIQGRLVSQDPTDQPILDSIVKSRQAEGLSVFHGAAHDSPDGIDFQVPPGWCWVSISDVATHRLGKMLDQAKNKGEPRPYLRNTNVHWFRFNLSDLKLMPFEDHEIEEFQLQAGDLIICEGGHGIGRTAVWRSDEKLMMFQKALHRVRPLKCTNSDYLSYCIRVYDAVGILQRYYTGAGIPHLTGKSLAQIRFPLPPIAEQNRIVTKVEAIMVEVDELESQLNLVETASESLLTSTVSHLLNGSATSNA